MASSSSSVHASNANCNNNQKNTLFLTDIPSDQNTTINVLNHFSKFGKILQIEVPHNGDPQAAAVTFETSKAAEAAFTSSEALLNNRFIKVSRDKSAPVTTSTDQSIDLMCSLCNRQFVSTWHRNNHIQRIHTGTGIKCNICNTTFTSANMFKKHCFVQHPKTQKKIAARPTIVEPETFESKPHESSVQEIEFLRLKLRIQSLKTTKINNERSHCKKVKSMKKKNYHLKDELEVKDRLLKENESALVKMKQKFRSMQQQNANLLQKLQNERDKVEMLRETFFRTCDAQNVNSESSANATSTSKPTTNVNEFDL